MPQTILRWFAPPDLAPLALRRHARALWLVSWPFFAVVAMMLGLAVLIDTDTLARRATTVTATGLLVATLHSISRRGRPVLASWLLVLGLSVLVTQRAWITGGIHAPVSLFYALFIVMAGALLGTRGAVVTAMVCTGGGLLLTLAELLGALAPRAGSGPALSAFVFVLFAIGMALVLHSLVAFRTGHRVRAALDVQMLVHDLRSPIQILKANLQLLRRDLTGDEASRVDDALVGTSRLQQMTTRMLDVGRLEAGTMPVRRVPTDLAALAAAVAASFRILQPTRDLAVISSGVVLCDCDPELMERVLENLVGNAMKHTAITDQIRVVVSEVAGRVRVVVMDSGPGVPRERRKWMFQPFNGEGRGSVAGGDSYGLGLAFCRLAVEALGGTIHLAEGDGGAAFVVELTACC